jgi:F-type H+-transporting ATPase subunit alpha
MLDDTLAALGSAVDRALDERRPRLETVEIGRVVSVGEGIAVVDGLPGIGADELVRFPLSGGDVWGIAADLDEDRIGVMLLAGGDRLSAGAEARRSGRVIDVPVGEALLGRVVDALGRPLDGQPAPRGTERRGIERDAPAILDRRPVEVPLQTGLKAVDALVPIGRGQRELILGDRQTGKTAIAVDTILNQRDTGVISIYCAIGQRSDAVAKVIAQLRDGGVLDRCVVLVAGGEDAPGLQYAAPYAAATVAEWFMARGRDTLVVFDDLTRHARAYRELSLLLRRPPGREAYPGDIFYIHSRLLERATRLTEEFGGGSMTALPVIETQAQNLSAYIPTNLISITDGQIYLSPDLFQKGLMPAIEVGRSVSRVGGKAQLPAYRAVAGQLRLSYSQFEELEAFARFGTRLDPDTRATLERGRRVRAVLRQPQWQPMPVVDQVAVLLAVTEGLIDGVAIDKVAAAEAAIRDRLDRLDADLVRRIRGGEKLGEDDRRELAELAETALRDAGLTDDRGGEASGADPDADAAGSADQSPGGTR